MDAVNDLRSFAKERGLTVYEAVGGVGVRFSDGFDVFWALPDERWHFLNRDSQADGDLVAKFQKLDDRRLRVVDAVRRYLAKQKISVNRKPNGDWEAMDESGGFSVLYVGAGLTKVLTQESNLVAAVQGVFGSSSNIHKPSVHRAKRHLSEFGEPLVEPAWTNEEQEDEIPSTPHNALVWMGLCKALKDESNFDSPEAFVAATQPKGRIGRALLQLAQRLPNAQASVELLDGSMSIDFSDEYDRITVKPRSGELRALIREMGPEKAGDHLADEYERINAARGRVVSAVFESLSRQGYSLDRLDLEGVGREFREFSLELGEELTQTIQQHGEEQAVRFALGQRPLLAEEAIKCLKEPCGKPTIAERELRSPVPAAIELPELTDEQIAKIDERTDKLLHGYLQTEKALEAYGDPLMWDASKDTWTTAADWLRLAERNVGDEYQQLLAKTILIDHGDRSIDPKSLERLWKMEPHHEVAVFDVKMIWQLRQEIPELASKWFDPQSYDDVPFAEIRARLDDPVAVQYIIAGLANNREETDEAVPYALATMSAEMVRRFAGAAQIDAWRADALRWADEKWEWNYGWESDVLNVAANMGWPEVGDRLAHNPYILPALLAPTNQELGILSADRLLLAWSKLVPSELLMKIVGLSLRTDHNLLADRFALFKAGKCGDYFAEHSDIVAQITNAWGEKLGVALAISWRRCRRHESNKSK
ncbi:MAG: hypothetical protein JXM70_16305 [Pirellulales bacterium]|nr:hypothetical protein [Pirellulales bacterium]